MPEQATLPFGLYESTKTFEDYDAENPQIWQAFKRIALQLISSGVKHFGGKAIAEILRYETVVRAKDAEFKINNSFISGYTRKFEKLYPQHKGFFEKRRIRNGNKN